MRPVARYIAHISSAFSSAFSPRTSLGALDQPRYLTGNKALKSKADILRLLGFDHEDETRRKKSEKPPTSPPRLETRVEPGRNNLPVVWPAIPDVIYSSDHHKLLWEGTTKMEDVQQAVVPETSDPHGRQAPVVPYSEPELCDEQLRVVELIQSGRNVFYTGSAGCGKSTVLKAFVQRLKSQEKRVAIVAPTGRAALDINGITTWTYAGWTPNSHKKSLNELKMAVWEKKSVSRRIQRTDVLVIDEISMVENLHFQRLNEIMKEARDDNRPFGGVQIVVTGDFFQLPPVKPFQYCITCGKELQVKVPNSIYLCPKHGDYFDVNKWAFCSQAWEDCDFIHVHLNEIHRQSDQEFIRLLQKCRLGQPFTRDEIDLLVNHPSDTTNAVKLYSTREEVRRVNLENYQKLKTYQYSFTCLDNFGWNIQHRHLKFKFRRNADNSLEALQDHRYEQTIHLKKGMLVVLLVNVDISSGLVNGSQGIIIDFKRHDPSEIFLTNPTEYSSLRNAQVKAFMKMQTEKVWPVVKFHNNVIRTIYADCTVHELGDTKPYSLLCRTQIPLLPAWAMSIHKSQGMTLSRVVVDLTRSFEEGQVYVALSRARSLEGLKVEGNVEGLFAGNGANGQVKQFFKDKFGMLRDI